MEIRKRLIDYQGEINYSIISEILKELKNKIDQQEEKISLFKRLLSVTDESLENVSMYIERNIPDKDFFLKNPPSFILENNPESYYVMVTNPVKNIDKEALCLRIDANNLKSDEELKQYYKETIANGKISDQGGAGLGLLIIARASGKKINYTFEKINEEFSYFRLIIEISK